MTWLDAGLTVLVMALLVVATHYRNVAKQAVMMPRDVAPAPAPVLVPAPVVVPTPTPSPADWVTVRYLSEKGHVIGTQQIPRRYRRPTLQWKRGNYVCASKTGEAFEYRRVGMEREG